MSFILLIFLFIASRWYLNVLVNIISGSWGAKRQGGWLPWTVRRSSAEKGWASSRAEGEVWTPADRAHQPLPRRQPVRQEPRRWHWRRAPPQRVHSVWHHHQREGDVSTSSCHKVVQSFVLKCNAWSIIKNRILIELESRLSVHFLIQKHEWILYKLL